MKIRILILLLLPPFFANGQISVAKRLLFSQEYTRTEVLGDYLYCGYDFWGSGGCIDITNTALVNLEDDIIAYCADEKTYSREKSFITFYIKPLYGLYVGCPIYQAETGPTLYQDNITVIVGNESISPCGLVNAIAIRIENGYVVGMINVST